MASYHITKLLLRKRQGKPKGMASEGNDVYTARIFTRKLQCPPQSLTIIVIRPSKLLHSGVSTKWCTQSDLLHFPSQKLL